MNEVITADDAARLGIGGNLPPEPLVGEVLEPLERMPDPLDAEALRERLLTEHKATLDRFEELKIGCRETPKEVTSEAEAQRILDFIAHQCRPLEEEAKEIHDTVKRAYLDCCNVLDQLFLLPIRELKKAYSPLSLRADRWLTVKRQRVRMAEEAASREAREKQRRADEEAARLRAEQAKKIAAGDRPAAVSLGRKAEAAEKAAEAAQQIIDAPPERVTIQGDYGAVGYTKGRWEYRVKDPRLVPKPYLMIDHDAVMHDINRKEQPVREIPGLEIFLTEPFVIRRC